jgi:NAD(P)-dependent dehydrogenase (short-subunit alcohol dehydrogenase family)
MSKTAAFQIETKCRRYEGRVAIVTGAAQGLGRVIARRLAEEGAKVLVADIQEARVRRTAAALQSQTGSAFVVFAGDLSQPSVADAMVGRAVEAFGRVDTLVNNAAALIRLRLIDFTEELLQQAVNGNLWTTLRCCKAVLPQMLAQRYGRIVNIGGEAWRTGMPFHTLLAGIGKGAIVGLTATLAGETVREGITVNCVSPGGMESEADGDETGRTDFRDPRWTPPEVLEALMKMTLGNPIGIGRLAHPTEVAGAVAFLGSPEASYVTGQHLGVSGGIAMI